MPVATPAVAAGHPATLAAALEVLGAGGNAFDAAIAAGFTAAVAEPVLTSLGGGGFLLARTAGGDEVLFDFFVDTPGRGLGADVAPVLTPATLRFGGAEQVFHVGHGSVAVPGVLAGYLHVHHRLGRLALDRVVAPAIRAATEGVELGEAQAAVGRLVAPILSLTAEGRARFHPGGGPLSADAVVRDEPLAALLADVAAGRVTGFGDDGLAGAIAASSRDAGGILTVEDLAAYRVVEREPLRLTYRGATLVTNPPPSSGATLIGRALAHLEASGGPLEADGRDRLVAVAEAFDAMTRRSGVGDGAAAGGAEEPGGARPTSVRGTTHVSVVDADGAMVSLTTSNGSGSGVTLGPTGVLANNVMGEDDLVPEVGSRLPAGVRVGSMMAPSFLERPGAPTVVLGSGGSERIRSAIAQTVVRLVDEGAPLDDAVRAARIHLDAAGTVQVEPGHDPDALAALVAARATNVWGVSDLYFGGVHAVATDGAHVGDPRRGGVSAALTTD